MTVQFDRRIEVKVDTIDIKGLHASFSVTKTLKKEPNTCDLTIYGLNADHRKQLAQVENPVVEIKAGYTGRVEADSTLAAVDAALSSLAGASDADDGFGLIFLGDVRDVRSEYQPPEWLTLLESGDGEKATQRSRINKSFAGGTSLATVITEVAKSMKVGIGNAVKKALDGKLLEAGSEFLNNVTLSGQSSKELDRIVKSAGLEWSIQDGVLQLLEPNKPLEDISIVLTDESGLIGSPTIGNDGVIKLTTLLNSNIVPGRQLEITTKVLDGTNRFRCERVEYVGAKFARDFFCNIEAKEL